MRYCKHFPTAHNGFRPRRPERQTFCERPTCGLRSAAVTSLLTQEGLS